MNREIALAVINPNLLRIPNCGKRDPAGIRQPRSAQRTEYERRET